MKEHVKICYHLECKEVDEIVIQYDLFKGSKGKEKEDPLMLIVRPNVQGLPKK
jgi:hypothetical protein